MKRLLFIYLIFLFICAGCTSFLDLIEDRLPGPHQVEGGYLFQIKKPEAAKVNLAGDFNNWCGLASAQAKFDYSIDPMTKNDKGIWQIVKPLKPGEYKYKFVIDDNNWISDPNNYSGQDQDGNSLLVVK